MILRWEKWRKDLGRVKCSNQVPLVKAVVRIRGNGASPCIYIYFLKLPCIFRPYTVIGTKLYCILYVVILYTV